MFSTPCSTKKENKTRAKEEAQNPGEIISTPGGTCLAVLPVPAGEGGSVGTTGTQLGNILGLRHEHRHNKDWEGGQE